MDPKAFHRKLAAILSADVAGYSHAGAFIRRMSNLAEQVMLQACTMSPYGLTSKLAFLCPFVFAIIMPCPPAVAQVTEEWVSRYNHLPSRNDYARAVAVDTEGHIYVTGTISSGGLSNDDVTVVKYDPNGNLIWSANYSRTSDSYDSGICIGVDGTGNVYVAAESRGSDLNTIIIKYGPNESSFMGSNLQL